MLVNSSTVPAGLQSFSDMQVTTLLVILLDSHGILTNIEEEELLHYLVLVGTKDGAILTYIMCNLEKDSFEPTRMIPCHHGPIYNFVFNSCTVNIATAGHDGSCVVLPLNSLYPQQVLPIVTQDSKQKNIISCKRIRETTKDKSVKKNIMYNINLLKRFDAHTLPVVSVRFTFDGSSLLSLGVNGRLVVFDTTTLQIKFDYECQFVACTMELSHDETTCFVAGTKLLCVDLCNEQRVTDTDNQHFASEVIKNKESQDIFCSSNNISNNYNLHNQVISNKNKVVKCNIERFWRTDHSNHYENKTEEAVVVEYTWSNAKINTILDVKTMTEENEYEHAENKKIDKESVNNNNNSSSSSSNNKTSFDVTEECKEEQQLLLSNAQLSRTSNTHNSSLNKTIESVDFVPCINHIILNIYDSSISATYTELPKRQTELLGNLADCKSHNELLSPKTISSDMRVLFWSHNSTCGEYVTLTQNKYVEERENSFDFAKRFIISKLKRKAIISSKSHPNFSIDFYNKESENAIVSHNNEQFKCKQQRCEMMQEVKNISAEEMLKKNKKMKTEIHTSELSSSTSERANDCTYLTNKSKDRGKEFDVNDNHDDIYDIDERNKNNLLERNIKRQRQRRLDLEKKCALLMQELKKTATTTLSKIN